MRKYTKHLGSKNYFGIDNDIQNYPLFYTFFQVTHKLLKLKNNLGQTLLTLMEVNRDSLSESIPIVLKREYGCHRRDMTKTELCLSEQLETSESAYEIIRELHALGKFSHKKSIMLYNMAIFDPMHYLKQNVSQFDIFH